jgi:PDZ domain-containing protein
MRRRGVTVLVGAVLLVLLLWQIGNVPVPYVQFQPGPTYDTLGKGADGKPIIVVEGTATSTSTGELRLTTIEVVPKLTLGQALYGWWNDELAVLPKELVYPPEKTEQQIDEENAQYFKQSQSDAEIAALRELGYPIEVAVLEVVAGFPATGVLRVDDVIVSVDGTSVDDATTLTELIRAKPAGTPRQVVVKRKGETLTFNVATAVADDGSPRFGVRVEQRQPHPFKVTLDLEKVGGPSAGLMFALGIIDTLKPEDLTGGRRIAGTGTINAEGEVGPIGGIPQKLVAAKAVRAQYFLTPAENCAEAAANAQKGLPLVKIATLADALAALDALRAGRTPPLCPSG